MNNSKNDNFYTSHSLQDDEDFVMFNDDFVFYPIYRNLLKKLKKYS